MVCSSLDERIDYNIFWATSVSSSASGRDRAQTYADIVIDQDVDDEIMPISSATDVDIQTHDSGLELRLRTSTRL